MKQHFLKKLFLRKGREIKAPSENIYSSIIRLYIVYELYKWVFFSEKSFRFILCCRQLDTVKLEADQTKDIVSPPSAEDLTNSNEFFFILQIFSLYLSYFCDRTL